MDLKRYVRTVPIYPDSSFDFSLKLRNTGLESQSGRIFVIGFVHLQRPGVCSAVYGNVHYKEHSKSFEKIGV